MALISSFRVWWSNAAAGDRAWRNMAWLFADRFLRQGVGLLVLVAMARQLGPADFGALNYAVAYVALVWSFTDLGMSSIVVRNVVRQPADGGTIVGTAFFLRLAAVLVGWLVAVVGIRCLRPADATAHTLVIIISTGMMFQVFETLGWWFEALVESKYVVWARSVAFLLSASVRVALIVADAPLWTFALANAAELLVAGLGIVAVFWLRKTAELRFRFALQSARSLLRDSWPLIFSNLAIVIYMRLDQVMLGNMRSDAEVGVYSVVVLIAEAAYIVPMIVMPSLLPGIVAAREESEALFYERLDHLYRLMAFLAYAISLPLILFSGWVVPLLFGDAYSSGGPVLAVLAVAGIFTFMGVARTAFLVTANWSKTHLATVATSCVLNILLNLLLIPKYGALGAAIASAIAYWFAVHGFCFLYPPLHRTGAMLTSALLAPRFWK